MSICDKMVIRTYPAMMHRHPSVNEKANLAGARMMTGKKIVNASSKNTPPAAKRQKKSMSCCPVGMLHGGMGIHADPHGSDFTDRLFMHVALTCT